jgi:vancomycin resistance protein YoaR
MTAEPMTSTSETLPPSADGALIETPAFEATVSSRRMPRLRAIFGAFIVGLVVALVASGAGLYAYDRVHDGQIVHGVRIAGVDVSDLGRDAAAARLRAGLAGFGQGTVVVSDGVVRESLTYAALGRGAAIDTLLDQAFAIGRTGTMVDRGLDEVRTATRGAGISPAVTVDATAVATAVAALGNREDRAPVDAAAITTASGFATVAARAGRTVDRAAMTAAIVAALSKADAPGQVDVPLITTPVAPTVDDAAALFARNTAAAMARDLKVVGAKDSRKISGSTIRGWISFGTIDGRYVPLIAPTGIEAALKPLAKDVAQKAKDATFLVSKSGRIIGVTASVAGHSLDLDASAAAVVAALQARAAGTGNRDGTVAAVVKTNEPKLTTDIAKKSAPLMRPISTWVTYYASGPHNGFSANISVPAQAISGTVVAPGAKFSFWKSVGEVSLAKGYKLGGAIIGGRSVEGTTIGGGICSTSTTLFNAALRAGFLMGSRKNHYYYIARYPKGLDATVFIGGTTQDMTWTNNTPYPVLIKAFTRPGMVRFTIYSVPTGRRVTISPAVVKNYSPSTTVVQYTSSLRPGTSRQIEYEAAGFDSWVTVTVRDKNGKLINTRTYYSHYGRVVGIILRGR